MKGLLIKDFYNLKAVGKTAGVMILFFAAMSLVSKNFAMLSSMMMMFSAVMPLTVCALDEQSQWYSYSQTMPISRRQIVLTTYVLAVIIAVLSTTFAMLTLAIGSIWTPIAWPEQLAVTGILLCAVFIFTAIIIPLVYKFGAEKARMMILLVFAIIMIPILLFMDDASVVESMMKVLPYLLPVLAVGLNIASYFITLKIFTAKEL